MKKEGINKDGINLTFWVLIGSGSLFFLVIVFAGSIISIGDKVGNIHPYLEIGFYVFIILVGYFALLRPLLAVLMAPSIPVVELMDEQLPTDYRKCRQVAKFLVKKGNLDDDERAGLSVPLEKGSDLEGPLKELLTKRADRMDSIMVEKAKVVFVSTAVSQNGHLDAIIVIISNFRMVRELVESFGYRPTLPHIIKIYSNIFSTALIADNLEEISLEEIFPQIEASIFGAIPGMKIVTSSIFQGISNSFLTLRIGYITKNYILSGGKNFVPSKARRSAFREASKKLPGVVKEALLLIPASMKKTFGRIFA